MYRPRVFTERTIDYNESLYYQIIIAMRIIYIGIFLFLTISFYVQKLSISAGNNSVNKSINNPEFLSWRFPSAGFTILLSTGPRWSGRSDSRHNDRVDRSVPQSRQSWQWFSDIYTKLFGASSPWGKKVENHCVKWCLDLIEVDDLCKTVLGGLGLWVIYLVCWRRSVHVSPNIT